MIRFCCTHFEVELDHIIKTDLLYVCKKKFERMFTFFQNTSDQIKAGNEVIASLSIIQFRQVLFLIQTLSQYISLGEDALFLCMHIQTECEKKEGKQLKRHCAYCWIWSFYADDGAELMSHRMILWWRHTVACKNGDEGMLGSAAPSILKECFVLHPFGITRR